MKAVKGTSEEKKFGLCTPQGPDIQGTAQKLIEWMDDKANKDCLMSFCTVIGSRLRSFFTYRGKKLQKEKVWGHFHQFRTSEEFVQEWHQFLLSSVKGRGSIFFYQHISEVMLLEVMQLELSRKRKAACLDNAVPSSQDESILLTDLEKNALRYVCGYICRKVRNKFTDYAEPLKSELDHALMELAGDEVYEENTEDWLNKVDRGGLWHVNDDAYSLFVEFEIEAKNHLKVTNDINNVSLKRSLLDAIMADDNVKLKWCLLSVEMTQQAADVLFREMLTLFITVRGFAFTTGCIEFYKESRKENLQKKKALRKRLN